MTTNRTYWIALALCPGIGSRTFKALLSKFNSPEAVFGASVEELTRIPRITEQTARHILSISIEEVEDEISAIENDSIEILTQMDDRFPVNLKQAFDAPPILFLRGRFESQDEKAVAIVGAREASEKGKTIAQHLAAEFVKAGWTVVSGLARGIDTAAHRGALGHKGRTIGVLGSGIRKIHPKRNIRLAEEIIQAGAILSEQPPDAPPRGPYLMARDRIVSGLSKATIVVEAGEQGGSIDTANKAWKQNRPVFAVDSGSNGTTQLLAVGAVVISPTDFDIDKIVTEFTKNQKHEITHQTDLFSGEN